VIAVGHRHVNEYQTGAAARHEDNATAQESAAQWGPSATGGSINEVAPCGFRRNPVTLLGTPALSTNTRPFRAAMPERASGFSAGITGDVHTLAGSGVAAHSPDPVTLNRCRSSRRYSPSDHAWNGQPRGVNGVSASAISAMCERPELPRCHSVNGFRNRFRARARVTAQSPCARTHASTKGPNSHGQTVP
jgi:hypothetical protein